MSLAGWTEPVFFCFLSERLSRLRVIARPSATQRMHTTIRARQATERRGSRVSSAKPPPLPCALVRTISKAGM